MPFLTRGKARDRKYRPKPINLPVVIPALTSSQEPTKVIESNEVPNLVDEVCKTIDSEEKISYQEVTYRVPKEERLLDLPLEEEVPGEDYVVSEESSYNIMPVGNAVPIGVVLKKKKKK